MPRYLKSTLFHIASIGSLFLVWELLYKAGFDWMKLFPPPTVFLKSMYESDFKIGYGSQTASVFTSVTGSIYRVIMGLIVATLGAFIFGTLFSLSSNAKAFFLPVIRLLAPIAPIAWIPLGLWIFGIGDQTAIFIVFMGVFFILTISVVRAIETVPPKFLQTASVFGATKFQTFYMVIIPAIVPAVFTSLRINFLAAWMAVLAAEMTGLRDGLGAIIMTGRNLFNPEMIVSGMFLIGVTGFLFDSFLNFLQNKFFWWDKI